MMLRYQGEKVQRKRWFIGGLIIFLVTVTLLALPLGDGLAKLSFDLPFLFRGNLADTNVVVLLEDRATLDALGQPNFPPARTVHAQLVDKLREEGAKLVVFDISFRASRPGEDDTFAEAIRRHGHVILGGVVETTVQQLGDASGASVVEIKPPADILRDAAAGWGLLIVGNLDSGFGVRKIIAQWKDYPTVPWLAAQYAGVISSNDDPHVGRWINFYGATPAMDQMTLGEVLGVGGRRMAPGCLRGKVVFVGFDPSVTPASGRRDLFATPFTRIGRDFTPGTEIIANVYANLANHDWLTEAPLAAQCGLVLLFGGVALATLVVVRRRWLGLAVSLLLLLLVVFSAVLQWHFHVWWNWLAPAVVQLPLTALLLLLCPRLPMVAFISYRREGGRDFAMALLGELRSRGREAFLDVNQIHAGDEFPQRLRDAIDRAPNFLLVLSPGALDGRITNPEDWMRREIARAFGENGKKRKNVIPIYLDGFDPKTCASLPDDLQPLQSIHAIFHHHEQWEATLNMVTSNLK